MGRNQDQIAVHNGIAQQRYIVALKAQERAGIVGGHEHLLQQRIKSGITRGRCFAKLRKNETDSDFDGPNSNGSTKRPENTMTTIA
jgi:hypothetical protein